MRLEKSKIVTRVVLYFVIPLILVALTAKPLYYFITFIMRFWYISVPSFFIILIALRIYSHKRDYKRMYLSLDNVSNQEDFEQKTGIKALDNGNLSKPYISWLMRGITKKFYKLEDSSSNDILAVSIALIILIFALFVIYSLTSGMPLI